jgi:hypothetical protein
MSAVFTFASGARAGDPPQNCYCAAGLSCPGMQVTVCPQGDFEQIRKGCGGAGDYIWVELRTDSNQPIPGVPWTDLWFYSCDPWKLYLCAGQIVADSLTGINGRTTFSGIIEAGGCRLSGGIWIQFQGLYIPARTPCAGGRLCLPIVVKSPDLTGPGGNPDGIVNLSDLVPFGFSYNKGEYQPSYNACCDYNDDNKCNLSDFAYFGTHYQHRCM